MAGFLVKSIAALFRYLILALRHSHDFVILSWLFFQILGIKIKSIFQKIALVYSKEDNYEPSPTGFKRSGTQGIEGNI